MDSRSTTSTQTRLLAATALAPTVWGTTYYVSTEFLPADRPLLAGLIRALPSGLVLLAWTRTLPTGRWWVRAAVLGTLNIGAFFALLFAAAFRLPGGVAATLGSVQPLIALGIGAVLLAEPVRARSVGAGLTGMAGVALLVLRADAALDTAGVIFGLAGAASMATGVVLTRRWGRPVPLLAFTSWQLVAGGLVLAPIALIVEGLPPMPTATNLAGFAWLTVIGTVAAYVLWFRGVQAIPVARVSMLGLVSPLVASLLGFVALDQYFAAGQWAGVVLVLAALALGTIPARSPAERPGSLSVDVHGIEACGATDIEAIAFRATELHVGHDLRQEDLAQQRAVGGVAVDAITGRGPDIAAAINPEAVEYPVSTSGEGVVAAVLDPTVHHRVGPDVGRAVRAEVGDAGVGDVQDRFIG